jgi:isopentenyl diphosphate isomerase/L-lactate dehydrogenase-like FMN-dependent dehydrogenase
VADHSVYPRDGQFLALAEIHAAALQQLPPDVAVYLESGAGTEQTLRANREAFTRHVIRPRPMSGVNDPKTNTEFLGIPLSVPLLTAPFGGDALFAHDGHLAVARANAACGTASIVPEGGSFSYEEVAAAAPAAARIGQLHPFESFDPVARRIKNAGYDALCVTVDCATMGWRVRNKMARFSFDPGVWFGNATDDGGPNIASTYRGGVIPDWTWDQLAEATARHQMPWIAKGILTPESAMAAVNAGASAILVSNHGGRQVDPAPASLDALPGIAQAVGGQGRRPHRRRRVPGARPRRVGGGHRPARRVRPRRRGRARGAAHHRAPDQRAQDPDDLGRRPRHRRPVRRHGGRPPLSRVEPCPGQSRPTRSSAETSSSTSSSRGTTRS